MRLLFWMLSFAISGYSQSIVLGDVKELESLLYVVPDTLLGKASLIYKDRYEVLDLHTLEKKSFPLYMNEDFFPRRYYPVALDSKIYFVMDGGGLVYTLKNDSIQRIDTSYDHKMQHAALTFVRDKKFFKYGGYGFWSTRNVFTYFDPNTRQWELFQPLPSKEEAPEIYGAYHIKNGEDLYFFNGFRTNPENRLENLTNEEVWHYSFKTNRWNYLGKGQPFLNRTNDNIKSYQLNNKNYLINTNEITEIDIFNNRKTLYKHSAYSPRTQSAHTFFFWDKHFFYVHREGTQVLFAKVLAKDFIGKKISQSHFYKNTAWWFKAVLTYLLLPVTLLFLIWKAGAYLRKTKKVNVLSNGLSYKNKFTEFDKETMEILNLLLSAKKVPSAEILKIVEKGQFSPAHNERLKVQKINDLNIKLQTLFGEKEAQIRSVKSKEDKRIRVYTLDRSYF